MKTKNDTLQAICRDYLSKLRHLAKKFNLAKWLDDMIDANSRGECVATEKEVEMLSRMVDDERVSRKEIPSMLGVSYRNCVDNEIFEKLKKLRHVGVYSKIGVLLFKSNK